MNITAFFQYQLSDFQRKIEDNGYECPNIQELIVKKGYFRCMARVKDPLKQDINRRCKKKSCRVDLCKQHLSIKNIERVDEYPDDKTFLAVYRKNIPDIDKQIDLKHSAFYIEEIKTRLCREINENKISLKTNMDILKIFTDKGEGVLDYIGISASSNKTVLTEIINDFTKIHFNNCKIPKRISNDIIDFVYKHAIARYGNPKKSRRVKLSIISPTKISPTPTSWTTTTTPTSATTPSSTTNTSFSNQNLNTNMIVNDIDDISIDSNLNNIQIENNNYLESMDDNDNDNENNNDNDNNNDIDDLINNFNSSIDLNDNIEPEILKEQEVIYITDYNSNTSELYIYDQDGRQSLYNDKGKIVGYVREWFDDEDTIPKEHKTNDNKVLNPENNLPVLEYEILQSATLFAGIQSGIYREYQYDDESEIFRINPNICKY